MFVRLSCAGQPFVYGDLDGTPSTSLASGDTPELGHRQRSGIFLHARREPGAGKNLGRAWRPFIFACLALAFASTVLASGGGSTQSARYVGAHDLLWGSCEGLGQACFEFEPATRLVFVVRDDMGWPVEGHVWIFGTDDQLVSGGYYCHGADWTLAQPAKRLEVYVDAILPGIECDLGIVTPAVPTQGTVTLTTR